ncbi:MAG: ATP-binding protein [Lentisphaeraceae bacterium]|nr:ATP-binding protein [Lentisphaeraceae bacterium]
MTSSFKTYKFNSSTTYWLAALLFLLIPSLYVIYLLNTTIETERDALKNEIQESFKANLNEASNSILSFWRQLEQTQISQEYEPDEILDLTYADSLLIFNENGEMSFPLIFKERGTLSFKFSTVLQKSLVFVNAKKYQDALESYRELETLAENNVEKASSLLGQARMLYQLGLNQEAYTISSMLIFADKFKGLKDSEQNIISLEAKLLFLNLEPRKSYKYNEILGDLVLALSHYKDKEISTSQRLSLSKSLKEMFSDLYFPLYNAEVTALSFKQITPIPDRRNALIKTKLPGYWQYTLQGRYTLLFSKETLEQQLLSLIQRTNIPDKTILKLVSPDEKNTDAISSIPVSSRMPGWQLSLNFIDPLYLQDLIDQRTKLYQHISWLIAGFGLFLSLIFLRDMKRRIQLADLKNDLVANVTHELKTPLASSKILLDTMISHEDFPKEKLQEYLNHLSRENGRLCNLVEHFLTFSKLDKNLYSFQFRDTTLDELIDQLEDAINGRFFKERKRIQIDCTDDDSTMYIDLQAILTVILNLIENALKFSKSEDKVILDISNSPMGLNFKVTDKGEGIPKSQQAHIFDRYYQTNNKLSKGQGGCGLGLSIVKTVLDAHKSKIQLISNSNEGSTFYFELPIKDQEQT